MSSTQRGKTPEELDVLVVGAGFAGLYQLDRLRSLGLSDAEIVDVALAAAARCFFSKALDALGVAPDAKYAALDPGRAQLIRTFGR